VSSASWRGKIQTAQSLRAKSHAAAKKLKNTALYNSHAVAAAAPLIVIAVMLVPVLLIRFRKRWVAAFNLAVTNRITGPFATRLPGFGIVLHVGRKSGRIYRTPVNVFRAPGGFMIVLTYGQEAQWVQNVLSAGGCQLDTRRVRYQLSAPTIVHDPTRRRFPFPVRVVLRVIGATDFIQLSAEPGRPAARQT
jgi:deazaflavin-dependent oxidoreductase (nitroreductase family)